MGEGEKARMELTNSHHVPRSTLFSCSIYPWESREDKVPWIGVQEGKASNSLVSKGDMESKRPMKTCVTSLLSYTSWECFTYLCAFQKLVFSESRTFCRA